MVREESSGCQGLSTEGLGASASGDGAFFGGGRKVLQLHSGDGGTAL